MLSHASTHLEGSDPLAGLFPRLKKLQQPHHGWRVGTGHQGLHPPHQDLHQPEVVDAGCCGMQSLHQWTLWAWAVARASPGTGHGGGAHREPPVCNRAQPFAGSHCCALLLCILFLGNIACSAIGQCLIVPTHKQPTITEPRLLPGTLGNFPGCLCQAGHEEEAQLLKDSSEHSVGAWGPQYTILDPSPTQGGGARAWRPDFPGAAREAP